MIKRALNVALREYEKNEKRVLNKPYNLYLLTLFLKQIFPSSELWHFVKEHFLKSNINWRSSQQPKGTTNLDQQ